jgi:hypothetical protein
VQEWDNVNRLRDRLWDRLSRSLVDFAKMMELFEQHQVAFVSVTQQFNTATSMGRLVLHILLSFAQFEREIISERTRDKIAATRRKGKWAGGMPHRPRQGARLGNSALLQGRLRCAPCGCAMVGSHTTKGTRRYRYYLCRQAQKRGWKTCPVPSVPAGQIESLVTEQIQGLCADSTNATFASWWAALPAPAQACMVQRLIERVDYDGSRTGSAQGRLSGCFRPHCRSPSRHPEGGRRYRA